MLCWSGGWRGGGRVGRGGWGVWGWWVAALALAVAGAAEGRLRRSGRGSPAPFVCPKGRVAHLSCACSTTFVRCVNTQLRDAEIFQDIATRFPRIKEISVAGNSLMGLQSPIFSTPQQTDLHHLHKLLIPNNYLVELTPNVFRFAPNLHTLDLSFNEIKLSPQRRGFLRPLSRLRHLVLRKGLSRPLKYDLESTSRQLVQLEEEFRVANLTELFHVDLSINFLRYIPLGFGCSLTGVLKKLNLEGNELERLSPANMSCLFELEELDLSRNLLGTLEPRTRLALSAFNDAAVALAENKLRCDCRGQEAVQWLRLNQTAVRDAEELRCGAWERGSRVGGSLALALPPNAFVCAAAVGLGAPPLLALLLLLPHLLTAAL